MYRYFGSPARNCRNMRQRRARCNKYLSLSNRDILFQINIRIISWVPASSPHGSRMREISSYYGVLYSREFSDPQQTVQLPFLILDTEIFPDYSSSRNRKSPANWEVILTIRIFKIATNTAPARRGRNSAIRDRSITDTSEPDEGGNS